MSKPSQMPFTKEPVLFFVAAVTPDGENADYFVWAKDKTECIDVWRKYEGIADFGITEPDSIYEVPTMAPTTARVAEWRGGGSDLECVKK